MKILYLAYTILENDGRTKELLNVMKKIGNVTLVSCVRTKTYEVEGLEKHFKLSLDGNKQILNSGSYMKFVKLVSNALKEQKDIDILFLDNFFVSPIGFWILIAHKPKFIIVDSRELYTVRERKGLLKKVFALFEQAMIRKADVVIAANEFRAQFMKKYYKLRREPLVFENIRKLDCENIDESIQKKYSEIISKANGKTKVLSTGGYDVERGTDRLVRAMKELDNFFLFVVGGGPEKDERILKSIVQEEHIRNVYFLSEKLLPEELAYFVKNCDIGVVNYHSKDLNNKFCASGKIYEFLFCGKPVITTENLPLIEMCQRYGIGEADNDFASGLLNIARNYERYVQNVINLVQDISVEKNNNKLAENIEYRIKAKLSIDR